MKPRSNAWTRSRSESGDDRERGGGDWRRHATIPHRRAFVELGRDVSGQRRVRGKAQAKPHDERQRVASPGLDPSSMAAARKKDSYFQAQYRRLAGRRGKKRAVIAVGHSLLEVFYHLLADPSSQYHDLGRNYFDTLDPKRLCRHLVKRLESLGYEVTLQTAYGCVKQRSSI